MTTLPPSSDPPPAPSKYLEPLPSQKWDIVISGTGVKQSLLAVALSRAGKKVLQLDKNRFYGGAEASFFGLNEVDDWVASVNKGEQPQFSNGQVWKAEDEGLGKPRGYTITLSPHLVYWYSPLLQLLREVDMTASFTWQAVGGWWVYLNEEEADGNEGGDGSLLGDLVASVGVQVVKAGMRSKGKGKGWNKGRINKKHEPKQEGKSEGGVEIKSGTIGKDENSKGGGAVSGTTVSDDVGSDIKTSLLSSNTTSTLRSIPKRKQNPVLSAATTTLDSQASLLEIPCTFEDIAWAPTLTDRHRTTLASFLRAVISYTPSSPLTSDDNATTLRNLLTTKYPLPLSVIQQIHALTLLPTPPENTPVSLAIPLLARHAGSLGKIPDVRSAAALIIGYGGSSELCQVWSRAAAVAGGINVLERGLSKFTENVEANIVSVSLITDETLTTEFLVLGEEDFPKAAQAEEGAITMARTLHVISTSLPLLFTKKYPDEKITPGASLVTFPAGSVTLSISETIIKNLNPVVLHIRSSTTEECPRGKVMVYGSTLHTMGEINQGHSFEFIHKAVESMISDFDFSSETNPEEQQSKISYTLSYLHTAPSCPSLLSPSLSNPLDTSMINKPHGRVITVSPLPPSHTIPEIVTQEAREIYTHVLLSSPGESRSKEEVSESFMQLSEEMRLLVKEMQDDGENEDY